MREFCSEEEEEERAAARVHRRAAAPPSGRGRTSGIASFHLLFLSQMFDKYFIKLLI